MTLAAASAEEEYRPGSNEDEEEQFEDGDEDGDAENEEEDIEEAKEEEVVATQELETLLLPSATFQGFGRGITGHWYDGKWH